MSFSILVSRKASSAGNHRIDGSKMTWGSWGNLDAAPLFLRPHVHFGNRHGVIAEDVHDLDGDLAPSGRAFVGDTCKLQLTVFFGAEGLPFVLENVIAGPRLLLFGNVTPLASRAQRIHETVHDFPRVNRALPSATFGRWNNRLDVRPLIVRQIARIAQFVTIVFRAVFGRPHWRPLIESGTRQRITNDSSDSPTSRTDTQRKPWSS